MNTQYLFKNLGLSKEESLVLSVLINNPRITMTKLSQLSEIARPTLYRIISSLTSHGLCVNEKTQNSILYSAASSDFIKKSFEDKKDEIQNSIEAFTQITNSLKARSNGINNENYNVNVYNGKVECRQIFWNSLNTKETIRSFGYRSLKEVIGVKFLTEWFNESAHRGQHHRMVANPYTYGLKHAADKNSKFKFDSKIREDEFFQKRVIDEKTLPIIYETLIYDNVFAIIQWDNEKAFGIEIINPFIAKQEKDVFDLLWSLAKPV